MRGGITPVILWGGFRRPFAIRRFVFYCLEDKLGDPLNDDGVLGGLIMGINEFGGPTYFYLNI